MVKEDFTIVEVVNIRTNKKRPMRKTTAENKQIKKKWKISRELPQEEVDKMNGLTTSAGAPFVPEYKEVVVTTRPVEPVKTEVIIEPESAKGLDTPEEVERISLKKQLDDKGIRYNKNTKDIEKLKAKLTGG